MGKVIDLKKSGMKATIIDDPIINKEQSINIQKTYIATVKKPVTKVTEEFYAEKVQEPVLEQEIVYEKKENAPVIVPSEGIPVVALPTEVPDTKTVVDQVLSAPAIVPIPDDSKVPVKSDLFEVPKTPDLASIKTEYSLNGTEVDSIEPLTLGEATIKVEDKGATEAHVDTNENMNPATVLGIDDSTVQIPQIDVQPKMVAADKNLEDTIASMPAIPIPGEDRVEDNANEELDVSDFMVNEHKPIINFVSGPDEMLPVTSHLSGTETGNEAVSDVILKSEEKNGIEIPVEVASPDSLGLPTTPVVLPTSDIPELSAEVLPEPTIGLIPTAEASAIDNSISTPGIQNSIDSSDATLSEVTLPTAEASAIDNSISTPGIQNSIDSSDAMLSEVTLPSSEAAPLVLDGSKETNLNKALDEVGGTIQVENIESVREFGEEAPVPEMIAPVTSIPRDTIVTPSIAPMIQPEIATDSKSLVKKAGFANSKFFMVVAITFFLASCVFLGYEAFTYFQIK